MERDPALDSDPMLREGTAERVSDHELEALRASLQPRLPDFLEDLATLVQIDSGSYTKEGVDRIGRWMSSALERIGARVDHLRNVDLGDTVVATFEDADTDGVLATRGRSPAPSSDAGDAAGPSPSQRGLRLLLIGHMDTVFDAGTTLERPFRVTAGRAYGPGVADMKCGLLAGLYALSALRDVVMPEEDSGDGSLPFERIVFILNPDEEIGSPVSTAVIREAALASDVVLVLESARASGDIVSSRKGIVDLRVTVRGHAAHAGVEPQKGRHAILEAAHKTIALQALNGRWPGVTCNVGVVRGGTRPNVVPDEVVLEIDLRAPSRAHLEAAEAAIASICAHSTVPDVTAELDELARHWPMEKREGTARLASHAQALAVRLGFTVTDVATGGASDANTTAGLGVPTLDGLGPIGGLGHSPDEYLEVDSIVPRVTLLAALMLAISRDDSVAALSAT